MFRRSSIGGLQCADGPVPSEPGRISRFQVDGAPMTAARIPALPETAPRRRADGGFAAPKPGRPERGEGGFTLLEIIAVIALMGLIAAVLIGGSSTMLKGVSADDVQNTALSAIAAARHSAVLTGRTLELSYDDKARVLDWSEGRAALAGDGGVRLLPAVMTSSILVGGQLLEAPLTRVRFYPDGSCDPFRLEITRDKAREVLTIDPWTCTALSPEASPGHS
jgi:general secretion pathway protein H